ncbi:MAG: hypothetical protein RDU24_07250 [Humidesulfovibrio sp.]|uniref:hypothetical protein n=1 Tax=Humidesulfovibrio sp. TaxID=2910988 RepID=UPI0027E66652|nr:hypothetical protein [Humidesulfovibrio sp.]MDQ7835163.1 hypothetical protein [Humidesulfovibrio sp.]
MPDTPRPLPRLLLSALALVLTLLTAAPKAWAAGDDVNLSLCKQVLSRILCKKENEFSYKGKVQDGVYIVAVFYASKNSEYLCAVMPDGQVIVQDRTWHPMRRVIPYTADSDGKCLTATLSSPECPTRAVIKACPARTPKDAKEQVKETFWVRPIPAILEEEYRAMTEKPQQNATEAAPPAAAPPK